ncbi:hypothetical protein CANINC_004647 [Pichia inconspicua]|uniref:TFIIS central domain-containing protein n=1 Tax=Pichia inconspicua TaxID=52247 RepID=A0A4V6TTP5_9ASCO|nr:hypothetical protein CANINC_004647 [[Candida] inconspicua]
MGVAAKSDTKTPKKSINDSGISIGDDPHDVWNKTRNACRNAVLKALQSCADKNPDVLITSSPLVSAKEYELELHKKYGYSLSEYKLRFRKDLTALRNFKTLFAIKLLNGDMKVTDFTSLDENELISFKQKEQNNRLLDTELKNSLGKQFPSNINEIKNQNTVVAEKWGISESAAKIDPEFEIN